MAFTKVRGPGIHTLSDITNRNINSSGIITASSFVGPLTASSGSSGTFDSLTVTGAVSIGGTLTYEDVKNIDSVGIITARKDIHVGAGISAVGVITATSFSGSGANLTGIDATKIITGNTQVQTIDTGSDGHVKVLTEGSERLRIDSSGKMGLGTNNPNNPLTIHASGNHLFLKDTATNNVLQIRHASGVAEFNSYDLDGNARRDYVFNQYSSEALRIDSSGRLLIGTTTEGHGDADNLTIRDSGNCGITIRSSDVGWGTLYFSDSTSGTGEYDGFINYSQQHQYLKFGTASTERLRITSAGDLKFNQTQSKINLNTSDGSDNKYLSINGGGDASQSRGAGITLYGNEVSGSEGKLWFLAGNSGSANGIIEFYTGGSERLTIESNGTIHVNGGSVGINEASPEEQLHITHGSAPGIQLESTSGGPYKTIFKMLGNDTEIRGSSGNIEFFTGNADGDSSTERLRIDANGIVRIANTNFSASGDADTLVIGATSGTRGITIVSGNNNSGNIFFGDDGDNDRAKIQYEHNNDEFVFTTSATERVRITGSGTLTTGISTANSLKLDEVSAKSFTLALNGGSDGSANTNSIFVYDTRKDSDGGAWRKRTTDTAWYNEPSVVGVTTWCGTRAEFPSVAVIVGASNGIFIHDGDDPDLPLWRSYAYDGGSPNPAIYFVNDNFKITAKNGIVAATRNANEITNGGGLHFLDFILDKAVLISANYVGQTAYDMRELSRASMERGSAYTYGIHFSGVTYGDIQDANAISVDMAVLPNAPTKMFGSERGISTPTIAVGLNNGVSVIDHHGNPYDLHGSSQSSGNVECTDVTITEDGYIAYSHNYATEWNVIPKVNTTATYYNGTLGYTGRITNGTSHTSVDFNHAIGGTIYTKGITSKFAISRSSDGLSIHRCGIPGFRGKDVNSRDAIIRHNSTSGWLPSDCRIACLASADSTNLTNGQTDPSRELHYGNDLTVTGTITKTAVATGAELMGYSGWSSSNYLSKSYDSDFSLGETQFTVMFWAKDPSDDATYITSRGDADGTETWRIALDRNRGVYFDYGNGSQYAQSQTTLHNDWAFYVCTVHASERGHIYVNGKEQSYQTRNYAPDTLMNDTDWTLTVGRQAHTTSNPYVGSIALFRVAATIPSVKTINEIYNDEKQLFLPNAKCTLTGTQNSITGMDYDDSTDTVHVGTSAGRSEFRGLVRINNTGTAVNSSISASNGFVVEE